MMLSIKLTRLAGLALALTCVAAAQASAGTETMRSITVTGSGIAEARPDRAKINAAVISVGKTAKATVDANSRAMTQVLTRLHEAGFDNQAIATTRYNVSPQFQKAERGEPVREISGYRINSGIKVTVVDLATIGQVLDHLTSAGVNKIGGLQFILSKRDKLADEALQGAMAAARHKAEVAAAAAGVAVGPVQSIEERGGSVPQPRMMAFSERAGVPINPGAQSVQASVSVTYALTDRD
jgi:uncharacterized protein